MSYVILRYEPIGSTTSSFYLQASYEVTVQSTAKGNRATMPYVEVHMIEGRTDEQRAKIAKSFTDTLTQVLSVKPEDVWIQFVDMPKTHFATSGTLKSKK